VVSQKTRGGCAAGDFVCAGGYERKKGVHKGRNYNFIWWIQRNCVLSTLGTPRTDARFMVGGYGGVLDQNQGSRWGAPAGLQIAEGRNGEEMCVRQVCWAFCRDCDVRCTAAAGMKRRVSAEVAVRSVWGFTSRLRSLAPGLIFKCSRRLLPPLTNRIGHTGQAGSRLSSKTINVTLAMACGILLGGPGILCNSASASEWEAKTSRDLRCSRIYHLACLLGKINAAQVLEMAWQ
jgi:hypothetical protein